MLCFIKSVNFHAKETPLKRGLKVHNSENDNEYNDSLLWLRFFLPVIKRLEIASSAFIIWSYTRGTSLTTTSYVKGKTQFFSSPFYPFQT